MTNLIVEISANRRSAAARSYYTAFQAARSSHCSRSSRGRHDRLERDDGWHIVERVIYADLMGDLRFHIKGLG